MSKSRVLAAGGVCILSDSVHLELAVQAELLLGGTERQPGMLCWMEIDLSVADWLIPFCTNENVP